ncbi:hypothetical protein BN6_72100 [Saccharothrix espanaensis DSM 44229]|uniref:Uncharacterized protein n=1 Tax=Saccharothrix espanaensis (strain ATCC 51144 / DSM 44229 / JCM 9112 / NBRC 15066 / NRRL 15764) TaxID=1179773 RepID=K0K2H3_SACES|nr:hypothetical protein BN6_72100 [Saccharothrix espanaensis DSM 44229]
MGVENARSGHEKTLATRRVGRGSRVDAACTCLGVDAPGKYENEGALHGRDVNRQLRGASTVRDGSPGWWTPTTG